LQKIVEHIDFTVPVRDVTEEEIAAEIQRFVRPFDIGLAPLIRMELLHVSEQKHILLFDAHHLVFDGASIKPFLEELAELYEGRTLEKPQLQYKDYAVWQQTFLSEERLKMLDLFWANVFEGEVETLALPSDRPRPQRLSGKAGTLRFILDAPLTQALDRLSVKTGSSIYIILLAAFNVLLHKYTGKTDIVVGSLSAGRSAAILEGMPGMFVQTLAMRNFPEGEKTFHSFLREVKQQVLECYTHEDYPADRFEQRVTSKKRARRQSLYQVVFNYLNFEDQNLQLSDCTVTPYPIELHSARYDVAVEAKRSGTDIEMQWNYSSDLFDAETAEVMSRHFQELLAELLLDPEQPIRHLTLRLHQKGDASGTGINESIDFVF
jgi:hypothetical protein